MKKTIIVYRLIDALNKTHIVVLNKSSYIGTIGGYDKDGIYHQWDSEELYHAYEWAESHGMKLNCAEMEIDIPETIFESK